MFVTFARSLLFAIVFYLGSVPIVLVSALSALFGQRAVIACSRTWAGYHYLCVQILLGITIRVEGEFPQGLAIIALKHEAMLETIEILRLMKRPAVVFKAELLQIPVWGWAARRHGVIPVSREAGASALRTMLKAARAAVTAGRPIVIFPEGTRVPPHHMPPLRPGFAGLYKSLGLPVVPVAVDSGRLWPKGKFLKQKGIVTFRTGTPIPPGLARDEIEARVHSAINALNAA